MPSDKMPVPQQSLDVFRLIAMAGKPLPASYIAKELGVKPHTIYRAIAPLLQKGLVREVRILDMQPVMYMCQNFTRAKRLYAQYFEKEFEEWFEADLLDNRINRAFKDIKHKRDQKMSDMKAGQPEN